MKICQKCGHNNLNSDKFCGQCGNKLIEPKPKNYCPKCKTTTQRNLKFCTECGTKLVVKPSYTKPETSTPSQPRPQSKTKYNTHHNDNVRKTSSESYIINLSKNTNVKSDINNNNSVYISKEENPYSKLTDSELIEKLEIAKNRHADAIKARDMSASRYMAEIKAIEKVLSSRHEKPNSVKLKKALSSKHERPKENTAIKTKKGTNYKDTKYKQVQRLFINSPVETNILLKEVLGYDHFPEEDVFNIIIKNYGVNNLKKAIKNAERRIEEKNNVIKTKPSTTIKQKRKTPKKSSEYPKSPKYQKSSESPWKFCRSCGIKLSRTHYACPRCGGTTFYNHLYEKYKKQNRKNKDPIKVKIKEEKDIKKDNRIKSKKLKNKLKDMPIY